MHYLHQAMAVPESVGTAAQVGAECQRAQCRSERTHVVDLHEHAHFFPSVVAKGARPVPVDAAALLVARQVHVADKLAVVAPHDS
jgi:hypothetical protein